jgi:pimeloyl-ACP methyl ester carboxylesterase
MIIERWTENEGVRLHYLEDGGDDFAGTPLVFVPGGLGAAEDYLPEFPAFAPRACLAMSLRGQGRSSAPPRGYAFADFVSDVEAILNASGLVKPCLLAYSMGAPFAIEVASRCPDRLSGLIIGDYPARYPQIPPEWVDSALLTLGQLASKSVAEAIQRESAEVELWEQLPAITCPALVLRGGQPGALLDASASERYRTLLPDVRVVTFPDSGHALWEPNYEQFVNAVKTFLHDLDAARQTA